MGAWVWRILWIDGLAALSAGVFVLTFRRRLAALYALPLDLVTFIGLVNVCYSTFGLTLAMRTRPRIRFIVGLSAANCLWACAFTWLAIRFRHQAGVLGLGTVLFEAAFVAVLAAIEWRNRHALAAGTRASAPERNP